MAISLLQNLYVRQRIWLLLLCSIIGLLSISAVTIIKAQQQFSDLKYEQYEKLVDNAINSIEYFHDEAKAGNITEAEAKQAAKKTLKKMSSSEEYLFFIHNSESSLLVFHPLILSYNDDTEINHQASKDYASIRAKTMKQKFGIAEPSLSSGSIFLEKYTESESGLIDYWYYELGEEKTPFIARISEKKPTDTAIRVRAFGKYYKPWNWIVLTGVDLDAEAASFKSWLIYLLTAAAIIMTVLSIFGFLISISISRPLKSILVLMDAIANGSGNLSSRLKSTGRNELTQFANSFNVFVERISETILQVSRTSQTISDHSAEQSKSMKKTVRLADDQLSETEMLASATNELSYSLKSVAERAQSSSNAASSAQKASDQSAEVTARNIRAINSLTEALLNTQHEVENMEVFSEKVSSVLEVIAGIAEQTNLLALNAAIEAARAGEQGRGFAVVADEVRTLASRTQNSTSEIHTIVKNLQSGTRRVVDAMKDGLKSSEICVTTATESNQVLGQVKNYVEEISQMSIEIATAVEQQSKTTCEIANSSQKIASNSKRTLDDNEKNQQSNERISNQLQEMDKLVKRFKIE